MKTTPTKRNKIMKSDLEVFANGMRFENPFILASAPPTSSGVLIGKAFDLGWAGAVTKTIHDEDVSNSNVSPRLSILKNNGSIIGMENIEMVSEKPISYWLKEIRNIKDEYPEKILIGSIMGAKGVDSWQKIAKRVSDAGADALELNFSCPNGVNAQGSGIAIGQDVNTIEQIVAGVKRVTGIPIIVKLTPNVTDIAASAKAALKGGADGICSINTVSVLIGIDIETLTPLPSIDGYSTFGGLSGTCVKPIGLRCVAEIAKSVDLPIYAVGGISNWKDAVEYLAVGASVVQVCTEVMLKGFSIIDELKKGLKNYLAAKGFSSVEEIKGKALAKLTNHMALSRSYKVIASIDQSECIVCGTCIQICKEASNNAIYENNYFVNVNPSLCCGCSLCSFVCSEQAIMMVEVS